MSPMAKDTQIGWVITGEVGIYCGWWLRRVDAISAHLHMLYDTPLWPVGGRLNDEQKAAWKKQQDKGRRAVKARITVIS